MSDTYWTIIPASVRLNNDLMAEAKLLYGDILGLSGRESYCWAKSDYFESITGLSRRQIFRALDQLEREGYIRREGNGPDRKIYPLLSVTQKALDRDKNGTRDHDENGTVLIHTTNTNTKSGDAKRERFSAPTYEDVVLFAKEKSLADYSEQFVDYYTAAGWMMGKRQMKDWRAAYRNWCRNERKFDRGRGVAPVGALMTYQEMLSHAQKNGFAAGSDKHYEPVSQGENKKPLWRVK